MIRFLGNIEAKTDTKGRVFIPAGFRKQLQAASEERLVLRKDVFQRLPDTLPRKRLVQNAKPTPAAAEQMECETPTNFPTVCKRCGNHDSRRERTYPAA